ncbi:hypothetical protein BSL78_01614 [Apostichopus japonicus]|uniref:Uncharacterized protein n=1 Tax=Stichopus japonicus TaxID=307972 RepID=A0A2G8LML4_STIJA|nr:hypothetical protein BSL78_01614 [Apostichopus japonicus]
MSVVLPGEISQESLLTFMAKHAAVVCKDHTAEVKHIVRGGLSRLMGVETDIPSTKPKREIDELSKSLDEGDGPLTNLTTHVFQESANLVVGSKMSDEVETIRQGLSKLMDDDKLAFESKGQLEVMKVEREDLEKLSCGNNNNTISSMESTKMVTGSVNENTLIGKQKESLHNVNEVANSNTKSSLGIVRGNNKSSPVKDGLHMDGFPSFPKGSSDKEYANMLPVSSDDYSKKGHKKTISDPETEELDMEIKASLGVAAKKNISEDSDLQCSEGSREKENMKYSKDIKEASPNTSDSSTSGNERKEPSLEDANEESKGQTDKPKTVSTGYSHKNRYSRIHERTKSILARLKADQLLVDSAGEKSNIEEEYSGNSQSVTQLHLQSTATSSQSISDDAKQFKKSKLQEMIFKQQEELKILKARMEKSLQEVRPMPATISVTSGLEAHASPLSPASSNSVLPPSSTSAVQQPLSSYSMQTNSSSMHPASLSDIHLQTHQQFGSGPSLPQGADEPLLTDSTTTSCSSRTIEE